MSKLINKSVIRAMSVGISAVMSFSAINLSAFADTDTTTPVNGEPEENGGA